MCTAINLGRIFGRTFDYEHSFGEQIILTPREKVTYGMSKNRYATMGVGVLQNEEPLYFDGVNEHGLCGAALNFPHYSHYHGEHQGKAPINSGSLVGFILGFCKDVNDVKGVINNVSMSREGKYTSLHWIFSDSRSTVTVESVAEGIMIYDNPFGVLANSPPFSFHLANLAAYMHLQAENPMDNLTDGLVTSYSRGMGGVGLPGDFSSCSRFVRALFLKKNTLCVDKANPIEEVNRFFHIASSVSIPYGSVVTENQAPVCTRYISCADREELTYYFTSYGCRQIGCVRFSDDLFYSENIQIFDLYRTENINYLN